MKRQKINPQIIKACDVRGIYPDELQDDDVNLLARAFTHYLADRGKKRIVIGHDSRQSSPGLYECALKGAYEGGAEILGCGLQSTGALYFAMHHLGADGALIISASHNPKQYNGMKFALPDEVFTEERLQDLLRLSFEPFAPQEGTIEHVNIQDAYISYMIDSTIFPAGSKEINVVWDPGNGAAGPVLRDLLPMLPGRHLLICGEPDGTFPHHHPDPTIEKNLMMLKNEVLRTGADLGIALDGDADRLGAVDERGRMVSGERLLTLFAIDHLREDPGARIQSEVKSGAVFHRGVISNGGAPVLWKVGHTHQKAFMQKEGIALAGETSGHIFFSSNRGEDDGIYAGLRLIKLLAGSQKKLGSLVDELGQTYDSDEVRIPCEPKHMRRTLNQLRERIELGERDLSTIDGIRVSDPQGFYLIRGSNTANHLTVRVESLFEEDFKKLLKELENLLKLTGLPSLGSLIWLNETRRDEALRLIRYSSSGQAEF